MVNEDLIKKKKKKKKRDGEEAGLDDTVIKKKKKKQLRDADGTLLKKKKKRKKSLKNSTLLLDPEEPIPDSQETVEDSDQELFGSQSPPPSPIKLDNSPLKSPPPLVKHSPAKLNGKIELASPDKLPEVNLSPEKSSPEKSSPENSSPVKIRQRPSPVMKFAKKTKIIPEKAALKLASAESDASGAEEDDVLSSLPQGKLLGEKWAPPDDPLISEFEQEHRDLCLLSQVKEKFPSTVPRYINWNSLFVYNMKPEEMQARFEVLMANIPREKNVATLVDEAYVSFCNAKVRSVPLTKKEHLDQGITSQAQAKYNTKKKLNAFSLYTSSFDLKKISREEIKEKWEALDRQEKRKLKAEARALNNVHGIYSGMKPKVKRNLSAYTVFSKEHMNMGMKMSEIGPKWKALDEEARKEYQIKADLFNKEQRERNASENEQSSPQ